MTSAFRIASVLAGLFVIGAGVCAGEAEADPFRFSVTCDMREFAGPGAYDTPSHFRGVCQKIAALGPGDFMVTPGDEDPPNNVQWTIQQYIDSSYLWYPVVGNHEQETPADMAWLRNYNAGGNTLPYVVNVGPTNCLETTFSFDYQNVHFVVINEYYNGSSDIGADGDVTDSLYNWLVEDLEANTKPHVFVLGHEPAYPQPDAYNGRERHFGDSLDKYPVRRDRFWDLLVSEGVVAYLTGHTHNYSAVRHRGVWQLDAAHARGAGDTGAPSTFFLVDVAGDSLSDITFTAYRDIHDGVYDYDDLVHIIDADRFPHACDGLMDFDPATELLDSLIADTTYGGDGQTDFLYFAWDDSALHLAFEANDFNSGGDLFVYFDSDTGGTRSSTDWHVVHEFPPGFLADYAICVEGGSWQDKRTWQAGAAQWDVTDLGETECLAYAGWANYPLTEISVPFGEIDYSPADTLKFLVYCQEEDGGHLWISFPPGNPTGLCPQRGYYLYQQLAPNGIPNEDVAVVMRDWVPPARVDNFQPIKCQEHLLLIWSPVEADTAGCLETVDHYIIYRDTIPDFEPEPGDSLGSTSDTSFVDVTAAIGDPAIQHYYIVRAVDQGSNKSISWANVGEYDREMIHHVK